MNIGQLIDRLRAAKARGKTTLLSFEWGGLHVERVTSYRGDYSQVALVPGHGPRLSCDELLAELERLLVEPMEGYKGGSYQATKSTTVYVSAWGTVSGTVVHKLTIDDWFATITTRQEDADE